MFMKIRIAVFEFGQKDEQTDTATVIFFMNTPKIGSNG
jgi:hypothetical protein